MCNIYPKRTINPDLLDDNIYNDLHNLNLQIIHSVLDEYNKITIAFGNIISSRTYLPICLNDIKKLISNYDINIKVINFTKQEHPRNPLYARDDTILVDSELNGIK